MAEIEHLSYVRDAATEAAEESLSYDPLGERPENIIPDETPSDVGGLLGQVAPVLPVILGSLGFLAVAGVTIILVGRARHRPDRHPILAELAADWHRWERDMRHHRGRLERLERSLHLERRELERYRRHAAAGLLQR
jgi:hypothetical protein